MKDKPQENKDPPLEDPNHVTEIFGDELVLAAISGGCAHLTFAAKRIFPPIRKDQLPTVKREVTCRLILTREAAIAVINQLVQLGNASALAAVQPAGGGEKAN